MMSSAQIPIMIGSDKATQTIIAPVQHDLIAAQAYAVGDLFIFNNGLYKVTTAIAQGGTITIGTSAGCNAQAVSTLAEELIQRVDDVIIDSGWNTINDYIKYRKINNIVIIQVDNCPLPSNGWQAIGTIPADMKPQTKISSPAYTNNYLTSALTINSNSATISGRGTTATEETVTGQLVYAF